MTHNCDFKELLSAMNARKFWESAHSPGRRKRADVSLVEQDANESSEVDRKLDDLGSRIAQVDVSAFARSRSLP